MGDQGCRQGGSWGCHSTPKISGSKLLDVES